MGSKYPVLPPRDIIKVLTKIGFENVSQKGSHRKYKRFGDPTRIVIIPMYTEIAKGTLVSILNQAGLSLEEFNSYL